MLGLNYVDVLILVALIAYIYAYRNHGFLSLTRKLIAFIGAAVIAFRSYTHISVYIEGWLPGYPGIADALSFIGLFFAAQSLIDKVLTYLFRLIPEHIHVSKVNRALGIIPALIDGFITIAIILLIVVIAPILPDLKEDIARSQIGSVLVEEVSKVERYLGEVFGEAAQETLTFLTVHPDSGESLSLPFKATDLSIDEESEREMLVLLNEERVKEGLDPLVFDETIVPVARAHSQDMWERSFFAHENPDGETPFDRMEEGGVEFRAAGENLALARTVGLAHTGLMNSPGHRRNILDPNYTRVGIGVIDGGIYGKMFTQNFAR